MAIIVSVVHLAKFMDCPVEGAHALSPTDEQTAHVDPPVNTVLPVITGSLTPGSVLTTTTGTWTSTKPLTYTYQWTKNGVPIVGSIAPVYVLTEADIGSSITVRVTATNMAGSSTVTAIDINGEEPPPIYGLLNSFLPKVTGTLKVGQTLTTDDGGWVGTPPPTFTYSWQRDGVDIPGATSNTYVLVMADAGHMITSGVTATNPADIITAYSADMGPVSSPVANVTLPVVSGATVVGQVLTCDPGTWTGAPAPTFAYQWRRNGVNIGGATGSTYIPVTADLGAMLDCMVTATNPSNSATAISNSVGPILTAPVVNLSNTFVSKTAPIGTTIGVLSVGGGTGTYTYTLTNNPGGLFAISGSNLNVAGVLGNGPYSITVQATGGTPSPISSSFTISVSSLTLSTSTIPATAPVGTTIGVFSVLGGTGSYTYTLTDPSGQFIISGANLNVKVSLNVGSYPISVQATGGVPSPVSGDFMIINIRAGVTWNPATVANTVLSGGNLIATNSGTTSNDQGARV
jgi:hypothetical protein